MELGFLGGEAGGLVDIRFGVFELHAFGCDDEDGDGLRASGWSASLSYPDGQQTGQNPEILPFSSGAGLLAAAADKAAVRPLETDP